MYIIYLSIQKFKIINFIRIVMTILVENIVKNENKTGGFNMKTDFIMTKQQFYIASLVCACIIIIAMCYWWFSASNSDVDHMGNVDNNLNAQDEIQTNADPEPKVEENAEDTAVAPEEIIVSPVQFITPVEGTVSRGYYEDQLTFYQTLDQYMAHMAVDVAAEENAPVVAAADGLISKVSDDEQHGVTVWIAHSEGVTTVYSNLGEEVQVEEGDEVFRGEVIGSVGNSSLIEGLDGPHLHLEVMLNGNHVNPNDYFNLAQ